MRKYESTTITSKNSTSNYASKKTSIVDNFVVWFRDFLDNAE
ncbi:MULTISPECIES: hypothetical protein [unclassified Polaribacter]|jgi:hypothetical protein|nr:MULTISPECIES: hypothetical protein [unclassified Polaribacter]